MMKLSEDTLATLLLTLHFVSQKSEEPAPLSTSEWNRFEEWLKSRGTSPGDLLTGNLKEKLDALIDKRISSLRIERLLNRSVEMEQSLGKWRQAGIWIITRSQTEYPRKLKERLQKKAPPLLFGAGNRLIFNTQGLAVIGSRDADEEDLQFTRELGKTAANQGYTIVSGGARGVDENAMLGALRAGGTSVGILAGNLLKTSASKKYKQKILGSDLVLISPYNPESGFVVGKAMGRNKYIYCMSEAAVVVRSDSKGGTWNGALENLRHNWVPLWVKPVPDPNSGNHKLVDRGAAWLKYDAMENLRIDDLVKEKKAKFPGTQTSFL
jgi:predicted Rossmann fold nucleotide-binding protein DprA/Smf involved in DNA uptake